MYELYFYPKKINIVRDGLLKWTQKFQMRGRSETQEKWGESGQLSVRQIPSTFPLLSYTPALQHSLQDLRWCKVVHILSEETLRGFISNKMSLRSSCTCSFLHASFQIGLIFIIILLGINSCWCCCPSAALESGAALQCEADCISSVKAMEVRTQKRQSIPKCARNLTDL